MVFCSQCGHRCDDGARFCSSCGAQLAAAAAPAAAAPAAAPAAGPPAVHVPAGGTWPAPFAPGDDELPAYQQVIGSGTTRPAPVPARQAPPPPATAPARPTAGRRRSRPQAPQTPQAPPPLATVAERHAECPICFEHLANTEPVACFVDRHSRRVCRHYFHHRCAVRSSQHNSECPLCRTRFLEVLEVPRMVDNPRLWFAAVDTDGNGTLSRQEVMDALKAQLPLDWERLERDMVPSLWRRWDPNNDGQITFDELTGPRGLVHWIRKQYPRLEEGRSPPIQEKEEWFVYWAASSADGDDDALEKDEVVRALIKTFNLSRDLDQVENMKSVVDSVFVLFDHDGDGTVDKHEFLKPGDGLADTIIASLQFQR
eukprot:m.85960 g.85960  ORF g.85960 m.85960 type:complete len:370 (+) comp14859_c0_seq2:408-1517(+)